MSRMSTAASAPDGGACPGGRPAPGRGRRLVRRVARVVVKLFLVVTIASLTFNTLVRPRVEGSFGSLPSEYATPLALAHRGGSTYAPNVGRENTVHAFRQAVDLGYRYLETDVHATADGQLVAFHDDVLDRVTDACGAIAELPWGEISAARIHGVDAVPTLDELFETFPQARFNIDIKAPGAIEPLVEAIRRHGAIDRVCIGSFSDQRLRAARCRGSPVHARRGMTSAGWVDLDNARTTLSVRDLTLELVGVDALVGAHQSHSPDGGRGVVDVDDPGRR